MDETVYKVLFEGDILPGFGQLDVQKRLAKLFGVDVKIAARLFINRQVEIKRGLSLHQAKNYVRALAKLGAIGYILPYQRSKQDVANMRSPKNDGTFTDSGSFSADAFKAYFEQKQREQAAKEVQTSFDIAVPGDDDPTIPAQNLRRRVQSNRNPLNDEPTVPALHMQEAVEREINELEERDCIEVTDVQKIREMQRITRQMLEKKRLYE